MKFIEPNEWHPIEVESLEPAADEVVKSSINTLVVAGPGAGKTELLAQRACYLLDTGICPPPYRILAISFKRDAAKNIANRVKKRSGDNSNRFDSLTLDAFAKNLIDRFSPALDKEWRPKSDYEVLVEMPRVDELRNWLESIDLLNNHSSIDFHIAPRKFIKNFFDRCVFGYPLPYSDINIDSLDKEVGILWWKEQLTRSSKQPSLLFPMINRLASYLLKTNSQIKLALQVTYSYIFLDEFQDTTASQYDLIHAAFSGSNSILTAVGDSKQRIMLWAGALQEIFDLYEKNFNAKKYQLVCNYRSTHELVCMQNIIAKAIESEGPECRATKDKAIKGNCFIMEFVSAEDEAAILADYIYKEISEKMLSPRDFCIIVRQQTERMIKLLNIALKKFEIKLRDESRLQDLLSEPVVQICIAILKLSSTSRAPEAWEYLFNEIKKIFGYDIIDDSTILNNTLEDIINLGRVKINEENFDYGEFISAILEKIGVTEVRNYYFQYKNGSFFDNIINEFIKNLEKMSEGKLTISDTINEFLGIDSIPAMTIHKSKSLEFHTVIFLGLEDSQWWNFASQSDEEKRNFFVAFSRAIKTAIFTYSDLRENNNVLQSQTRSQINDLYSILKQAGVKTIDTRNKKNLDINIIE